MIKNLKNIMVLTLVGLSLSSCNIYSKYQRAEEDTAQVDSLYRFITSTEDTTTIATLPWQELFVDSKLQGLIAQGLENNNDLNVARLNVEQAEVALRTSRLAFIPSVALQPQGAYTSYAGSDVMTYNISVAASWEVDIFGRLRNTREASRAALESSRAYSQAVQTSLVASIANSYYSLLLLDEQLSISLRTIDTWNDNIRVLKALKQAGMTNETAVLQAQANKIALDASVVTLQQQIYDLEGVLSILVGQSPSSIVRGTLAETSFPDELAAGVPMALLSNRPDVRQAEYNLAQKFYSTNAARSALYPSLTLSGAFGFTNSGGVVLNPGDWLTNVVASLVQPLFNGGALRGQLEIAELSQEQSVLQFKQMLLTAGQEVNSAMSEWQSARARIALTASQVEHLDEAVRSSELLMKHSSSNYLEVLTAQFTLLQAQLNYASAQYDEIQGVINLYRSVGGGSN